jgi:hypothetical protein
MANMVKGGYPEFQEGLRRSGQRTFDMSPEIKLTNKGKTLEKLTKEEQECKYFLGIISQACELAHTKNIYTMKESQSIVNAIDYLNNPPKKLNSLMSTKELREKKQKNKQAVTVLVQACELAYNKKMFSMKESKNIMDALDYLNK